VRRCAFIPRVPGAAQHEATAQWCAADPGPLRTPSLKRSPISGAPLHFVTRCTASGTRFIGRRGVISLLIGTAAALACPLPLRAQQPHSRPLIGVLSPLSAAMAARNMEALRQGLRELGYVEGRNIAIEFRYADGDLARLPALASELAALQPAVIIAGSAPGAVAARDATRAIPIVMASVQDPMALGLAASMARPGGNVTGFWAEGDDSLIGKRLELFKDAVPGASRLAVFVDPTDASDVSTLKALPAAARALRLDLRPIEVHTADLEPAFAAVAREGAQGLYVSQNPFFFARRAEIAALALRARLPSVDGYREFAVAGGLISYATSLPDFYRRFGAFVDKIFKGANAGDLPIERATKFELVVNLKTAKALGLTIPETFLLRADEVIE
jgi:putative ABC transport system substrate-binding protein